MKRTKMNFHEVDQTSPQMTSKHLLSLKEKKQHFVVLCCGAGRVSMNGLQAWSLKI